MIATVPLGAVQEVTVLSNAFSSEYGWTAGPALNIVTKSGTNTTARRSAVHEPPRQHAGEDVLDERLLRAVRRQLRARRRRCTAINPVDIPDELSQYSGSVGGPIVKDRTFFFAHRRLHAAGSDDVPLAARCRRSCCRRTAISKYTGHYRQTLFNGRLDHKLTPRQTLMLRTNFDRFYDDNPQDAVGGTSAPSVARRYSRKSWTAQVNHTAVLSSNLLNEARFAYLNGDPVTHWEAQTPLDDLHARRFRAVHHRPVARVRSLRPPGAALRHAVVVARPALPSLRRQRDPSHLGRHRQRARHRDRSARSRSRTRRRRRSIS